LNRTDGQHRHADLRVEAAHAAEKKRRQIDGRKNADAGDEGDPPAEREIAMASARRSITGRAKVRPRTTKPSPVIPEIQAQAVIVSSPYSLEQLAG
jgi:hypothetical protein